MEEKYYAVVRSGSNDDLTHWKYIKKYKKNGKMRYVYNVGSTGSTINGQKESGLREYSKLQDMLGYDERDAAGIADIKYKRANDKAVSYNHGQSKNPNYDQKTSDRYFKAARDTGKRASKAYERYKKTPLGKLDQMSSTINAGRAKVSKALTKLAKSIAPKEGSSRIKTTNYSKTAYIPSGTRVNSSKNKRKR